MSATGSPAIDEAFGQAVELHRAGKLQDAEQLYRSILRSAPEHAETNHNLGIIAVQVKQPAGALRYFRAAIEADPTQGRYRLSHVNALIQSGKMDAARQALARSLQLDLDRAALEALTGVLANHEGDTSLARQESSLAALFAEGRFSEAGVVANRMTKQFPLHGRGWMALGMARAQTGNAAEAVAPFQNAAALLPNDVEAHFNLCVALKDLGRNAEAETSCRRALAIEGEFAEAHGVLGGILQGIGRHAQAESCLREALRIAPDVAQLHCNLGVSLQALGRTAEAEAKFRRALEIDPAYVLAHINLGGTLKDLGRLGEAEASLRRAVEITPQSALALCNLGAVLNELGLLSEAEAGFRSALEFDPNFVDAHSGLGAVLQAQGRTTEAESSYRQAMTLKSDLAEAGNNLASFLITEGDALTALNVILQSLAIRETEGAKRNFVNCVRRLRFTNDDGEVRAAVIRALTEPWTRPAELATVGVNLVKLNPAVQACMARPSTGISDFATLAADPLLCTLLNSTPVCDLDMERFLAMERRAMLEAAGAATALEADVLKFCAALSSQCFINEYVYPRSVDELRKAEELRDALHAALDAGATVPALMVLAVAAYFPLSSLPSARLLLDAQWPDAVSAVLDQQVREPAEELRLRESIPRLTAIDDEVSRLVQKQYEENPYPRWVRAAPAGQAKDIAGYLRQRFPLAPLKRGGGTDGIDLLIAGCGTGQHAIETTQLLRGSRVLAADLSMNSLGYAKRKTRELELTAIEYAQADLLQLGSLDRRFDVIESVGVLHHLADPWAGWRVLLSLLRPGGVMRLGFYSELARRNIVKARAFIAEKGYAATADDIRRCRQDLLDPGTDAALRTVTELPDFFSTSDCRDLLFHVQEHRMTLVQIEAFLREHRLQFVGFEIGDDVRRAYGKRFPADRAAVDLAQWQAFENENPDTFISMYQFWIQKLD